MGSRPMKRKKKMHPMIICFSVLITKLFSFKLLFIMQLVVFCTVSYKGVLIIYTEKPEIPVGKSNGSRHSVWEASENMGCNLRGCNFSAL